MSLLRANSFYLVWGLIVVALVRGNAALTFRDLYPFGADVQDTELPYDDDSSSDEIKLQHPVTYFSALYHNVFVNHNGFLSLGTAAPTYQSLDLKDLQHAIIAPFYADVDTRNADNPDTGNGKIYYR